MDKQKRVWPRWNHIRKPVEIENLKPHPNMVVTCGMAHGWRTGFYISQDTITHGANAVLEVLRRLLDQVWERFQVQGRRFPSHLVVQTDNTVAQTKNNYCAAFMTQFVSLRKLATITVLNPKLKMLRVKSSSKQKRE
jgi:hypothetical protein